MDTDTPPTATVRARIDKRRRISLIWLIPLVTILIGAWLAWNTLSKRGPTITITFETAEGLQAGQSHVRHKDVDMGLVTAIVLSDDLSHVVLTVQMNREAEPLLTEGAKLWVVKPRLFAGNISGISTLLSGSYIELMPAATPGGRRLDHFTGLENPPVLQSNVPGNTFLLKADRLGSISLGSPVFYRDLNVGEVLGWDFADMADSVTIHAFIRAPFDRYVHDESRFWNASGVSVKLGAGGVQLELESLRALLLGGIAFDTPLIARKSSVSAADHEFTLYANRDAADNAGFNRRVAGLAYFTSSVSGLAPGSPVQMQGLRIGQVTSVGLEYDPKTDSIRAPVYFEVEPERIADVHIAESRGPLANVRMLVARGMRAQLETTNLLTGQMAVEFAFVPDAPSAQVTLQGEIIVIPTAPGGLAGMTQTASELLTKINHMPFEQIGQNLNKTLEGASEIANGRELKETLQSLQTTMNAVRDVAVRLDAGAAPALKRLPEIAASLQETLTRASKVVGSLDTSYGDTSRFRRDLDQLLPTLNDTARSLRILADLLTRHPEALIRGRTGASP
jgi:paraquat-inducible protein B